MKDSDQVLIETEQGETLTLFGAVRDLGFIFWLFAACVGAPSIISLVQTIFVDFRLLNLLQWILDGYRDILDILASTLEPIALSLFDQISNVVALDLDLLPHWQPLFIILTMFISANSRTLWADGYRKTMFVFITCMVTFALVGSWIAGLVSPQAAWWWQGLAAAAPVFCLFIGMTISYTIAWLCYGFSRPYRKPLYRYMLRGSILAAIAFILASCFSAFNILKAHSGLTVLLAGLFVYGLYWTREGFKDADIPEVRFGLRLTGGFLFAIIVIGLNTLSYVVAS